MPDAHSGAASLRTVQQLFAATTRVQRMLDAEAALARAQAALGIIPASAAEAIEGAAKVERFDVQALLNAIPTEGNLAIPLVRALTSAVARVSAEAASFVHWGATSQDVIDTGLVLQLREALAIVLADLARADVAAAGLARRYAATPMAARTWLQQATPTTFGLKAAGWLDALLRIGDRLQEAADGVAVLQFGAASGTLAAFGSRGVALSSKLGRELDLCVPDLPWHAHRDRLGSLAGALGVACGTLGKIARDISLLSQTEVQEATEHAPGGSSAMPHKRNPVMAARALAASVRAPGLVATLLAAMPQEHERALGGWQAEWDTLPALVIATADAAEAVAEALEHLDVHPDAMNRNLELTGGLIMAEPVVLALAGHVGRSPARALVDAAVERAAGQRRPFRDVLAEDPDIARWLDRNALETLLRPESYLGAAADFVARVLAAADARRGERRRAD
jgi:3-carboxy-cis,cis-muconate cycloisomerase